jgi:alpha-D-ribose 1-methylphosphonate 5-triphosphate diphosphatase
MVISLRVGRMITGSAEHVDDCAIFASPWVTIEDGRISAIGTQPPPHAPRVDLRPLVATWSSGRQVGGPALW